MRLAPPSTNAPSYLYSQFIVCSFFKICHCALLLYFSPRFSLGLTGLISRLNPQIVIDSENNG
jgi:hypothetical protein